MNLPAVEVFGYLKKRDFEILELPHADRTVSTFIALFNKDSASTSSHRRRAMTTTKDKMYDIPQNVSVRLSLPKFAFSKTLKALGIEDLFDADTADLSGIDTAHAVPLNEAMHKSYIAFNEDGEQAARVNEVDTRRLTHRPSRQTIDFIVDRPFMFVVHDLTTGCCMFMGYVANPLQSE